MRDNNLHPVGRFSPCLSRIAGGKKERGEYNGRREQSERKDNQERMDGMPS